MRVIAEGRPKKEQVDKGKAKNCQSDCRPHLVLYHLIKVPWGGGGGGGGGGPAKHLRTVYLILYTCTFSIII